MPKLDDVYRKIGNTLNVLLTEFGQGFEFNSEEITPIYDRLNPGDQELLSQKGKHSLEGYLNGMIYSYVKFNNNHGGCIGPTIIRIGRKRYQIA